MWKLSWVAFTTILRKELTRIFRIWQQTLIPPAITTSLYFIIFGHIIGSRIGTMAGHPYIEYIAPGLIMMSVITNAYAGSVSGFFSIKFQRSLEELLISPTPNIVIIVGFMCSGIMRAFLVGVIVTSIALLFTRIPVFSYLEIISVVILAAGIFSLGGILNAVYARNFDDISLIPNFILTPLTYLGGVFYSVSLLSDFWRHIAMINPIVYIMDTFRYGFLGYRDSNILLSFVMMISILVVMFLITAWVFDRGYGLRE